MEALRIANSMGKMRFLHSINNRSRHLRKFFQLRRTLSHQNRILSRFYKKFSRMRPIPKRPFLGNGLCEFFVLELLFFSILIFYKKLKMLRKIGLFFLIFLGFFLIFSWKNLYQNIMFAFFLDSEIPEIRYNQSLQIANL